VDDDEDDDGCGGWRAWAEAARDHLRPDEIEDVVLALSQRRDQFNTLVVMNQGLEASSREEMARIFLGLCRQALRVGAA